MSDSRVNKQKLVNFHPTASNLVSCLNGSSWNPERKALLGFWALNETLADVYDSVESQIFQDSSGNGNHSRGYNLSGSASTGSMFRHEDVPWGNSLRKGIHKFSLQLGTMRSGSMPSEHLSSKLPGWSHNWDYGVEMPYIQLKPSSLAWTGSDGAVNTGKTDTQFFEGGVSSGIFKGPASGGATPGYTFSLWIKPSQGVFTTVAGEKVGMIIYTWDPGEAFWYRVEDGKFAFEINSNASAAFDWQARTKKGNLLKPDRWYHVAVTRDPGARQAPRIYLNGKRLEIESKAAYAGASSGAGVPRNYAGSNFYIGRWGSSPTVMFNVNPGDKTKETKKNFVGRVTQWMLFGAQLSERDIYTIYGASLGASERKSGNLDIIPQRERLFIRDNKTGSYPTIQRSGIDNRHGNYRSFYDDRNTIIFKKHKDVFPGEIDKINKGFTKDDIIGWWRMQNLMRQANSGNWRGRTKINTIRFNDVSDNMVGNKTDIPGVTGQRGSSALNTNFQCLIDSGPNNLTGSYHGQATFTTDPKRDVTVHMTTASRGPFPKPDGDDIALMSPDQLSRWGGRKSVMLLQTGSKPAFITFKDNVVPRMRLIRDLPNNVKRDKPWTLSMWVNLKHKLTESAGAEQRLQYHGLFRIENNAGAITRARLRHDRNTGNWQIKWWVYGVNTEPTSSTAIGAVETNAFIENGLKPTIPARTGSIDGIGGLPQNGLPEGWNHIAFVYRGGRAKTSEAHWEGRVRRSRRTGKAKQFGGRMQIWLNGRRLMASASLANIDNFARVREESSNVSNGKTVIFGHYHSPAWRAGTHSSFNDPEQSLSGSLSGSIAEVAFIGKALKSRGLNRIIKNGLFTPEVNVTDFPLLLEKSHIHNIRMPSTDIRTFGSTLPGIADERVTFTKGDDLMPFDDRKTLIGTASNLVGTPASVSPDLEAPLHSKASFSVNITPKHDMFLLKYMHTGPAYGTAVSSWGTNQATSWNIGRSTLRALSRKEGIASNKVNGVGSAGTDYPTISDTKLEELPGLVSKGGKIEIGDYTGFVYYNFEDAKWDQIGTYDPVTGNRIHFDYAQIGNDGSTTNDKTMMSASYPQQFKPCSDYSYDGFDAPKRNVGTGRPHIGAAAPYGTKYHATSSNVLRVSDYITQPFLLERVRVEIPVEAYRDFGGDDHHLFTDLKHANETVAAGASQVEGAKFKRCGKIRNRQLQSEDNLVFFLYRQTRPKSPHPRPPSQTNRGGKGLGSDASAGTNLTEYTGSIFSSTQIRQYKHPTIVSGSQRYLICSGVATFYNDVTIGLNSIGLQGTGYSETTVTASNMPRSYEPVHGPAWKYNWGVQMPLTSTTGPSNASLAPDASYQNQLLSGTAHGYFTGSIIMDISPAIQGRSSLGNYAVFGGNSQYARSYHHNGSAASFGGPGGKHYHSASQGRDRGVAYGFWPGGTAWKNIFSKRMTGKQSQLGIAGQGSTELSYGMDFYNNLVGGTGNQYLLEDYLDHDPRTSFPGSSQGRISTIGNPMNQVDNRDDLTQRRSPYLLLPGDELVVGIDWLPTISIHSLLANELSGSYVKLLSSGSGAKITFYGSFFKEGKPYTPSLNQNLTSNAVHEVIGNDPVVDQYMISTRESYSGSYIDNLMRGGPPNRRGLSTSWREDGFALFASGNAHHGQRWRQSVVGQDELKVFSTPYINFRSGSGYGVFEASTFLKWYPIPKIGGPVWGVKHQGGPFHHLNRFIYYTDQADSKDVGQSGSVAGGVSALVGYSSLANHGGPTSRDNLGNVNSAYTTRYDHVSMMRKPIASSLFRGVRLVTENERYYDSLIPNLIQYAKFHPGAVVMGKNHPDTRGTKRPAISLPHQTSILSTGSRSGQFAEWLGGTAVELQASLNQGSVTSHYFIAGFTSGLSSIRPATTKGGKFYIEPTDRGTYGTSNSSFRKDDFGKLPSVTTTTPPGGHSRVIEKGNYDGSSIVSLAASTATKINQGVFSGSLAYPFEMSPRRSARPQRTMLTMFTGTSPINPSDASSRKVNPNMYMFHPKQVRTSLFRLGNSHIDSHMTVYNRDRDRIRIRMNASYVKDGVTYRDRRGLHLYPLYIGGTTRTLAEGLIHCMASGHTSGTFSVYRANHARHPGAMGYRYGLINTEPMNSTAVFRHDRFGQFRDMLEQRQYTRFYKRIPTSLQARRLFRRLARLRSNVVTTGPVSIKFRSTLTNRLINPTRTYSQNLSPIATSSLPYFDVDRDGKYRNRPFPFDESILDSHIVVEEDI